MFKQKTRSTLLSIIVALSILVSCGGSVLADPVDPQQGDTTANTEQAGPEDPADSKDSVDPADTKDPENQEEPEEPAEPAKVRGAKSGDSASGDSFGNGLSWSLSSAGELVISGEGAIPDYTSASGAPWADQTNEIITITIDEGITSIGAYAFSGCSSATSINLPTSGITSIGDRAFENCGFKAFSMPYSVRTIGEGAFYGCSSLANLSISYSATSIGEYAFSGCAFQGISIPYNLTSISNGMFANCPNLNSIYLDSNIISIGESAFSGCTNLSNVYMSDSLKTIGKQAFMNSGIQSLSIPKNITVIKTETFSGCTNLERITFGESLTTIETLAFSGCTKLTSITINDPIASIAAGAFSGCSALATVNSYVDPDKLTWGASADDFISGKGTKCLVPSRYAAAYTSKFADLNLAFESSVLGNGTCGDNATWLLDGDGTLIISGTGAMYDFNDNDPTWDSVSYRIKHVVINSGVTSVGNYAFSNYGSIESVTLSETVSSIGDYAFSDTNNLRTVNLSEGLTVIKDGAFQESAIKSLTIPSGVTTIGYAAFDKSQLESITFAENSKLKNIPEKTFNYCTNLKSIVIPDSVTSIGIRAFYGCEDLSEVVLPKNLSEIGAYAFCQCQELESITIPGSVALWGVNSFQECLNLTSVTICDGVKEIPDAAFRDCPSLSSVTMADSITKIGVSAFFINVDDATGSLQSITLPSKLTNIGAFAFNGQVLTSLTIPGGVETIDEQVYGENYSLTSLTFLKGTKTISDDAGLSSFMIKSVSVPSTVTFIGYNAFGGVFLEDLYLYPNPDNLINFDHDDTNINSSTKIHVLNEYLLAYQLKYSDIKDQFVGDLDPNGEAQINTGAGIHLYGYTLSLAGDVGVNFWFNIDDKYLDNDNYILFTVNGQEQTVKVSEAASTSNSDYLAFRCGVAAKEMSDEITAQFFLADGTPLGDAYTYSVREYANYILTHDSYSQYAKTLVKAMLNYGASSQKHFGYNTSALANAILPEDERVPSIATPNNITFDAFDTGYLNPEKVSLVLNSTVSLKLYFNKTDAQGKVFKIGDTTLRTITSGSYLVVYVDNITAMQFCSLVTIDVYQNNAKLGSVNYVPAKYCKLVVGMPNDDVITDDLKLTVSALYYFGRAAENYVAHS